MCRRVLSGLECYLSLSSIPATGTKMSFIGPQMHIAYSVLANVKISDCLGFGLALLHFPP